MVVFSKIVVSFVTANMLDSFCLDGCPNGCDVSPKLKTGASVPEPKPNSNLPIGAGVVVTGSPKPVDEMVGCTAGTLSVMLCGTALLTTGGVSLLFLNGA